MTWEMPRKLPPFVTRERNRHGTVVFYFRRGKGARTRLPPLSADSFDPAYQAALAGAPPRRGVPAPTSSLRWLIDRYRETANYRALSYATRRQRDNIFKHIILSAGMEPYRSVSRGDILKGIERRAQTPSQARNFLDAMRGVFRWALNAEMIANDPTASVKNPPRPKSGGFKPWTGADVDAYEARWPEGTKERVWLHVLLYTGLRRGDAVTLGKQHVKDGSATLRTEKNDMEVTIPILPMLAETLASGPIGDLAFIVGENGRPLAKETFGNFFRKACDAAGLEGKSAHGLRKLGASRAAEAGATVSELEALFGWKGGAMASHYTQAANRKKLSQSVGEKIKNAYALTAKSGAGKERNSV